MPATSSRSSDGLKERSTLHTVTSPLMVWKEWCEHACTRKENLMQSRTICLSVVQPRGWDLSSYLNDLFAHQPNKLRGIIRLSDSGPLEQFSSHPMTPAPIRQPGKTSRQQLSQLYTKYTASKRAAVPIQSWMNWGFGRISKLIETERSKHDHLKNSAAKTGRRGEPHESH